MNIRNYIFIITKWSEFIRLRYKWRDLVNRVISFRVPLTETKFLNSFTKRLLLLGGNQFSNKVTFILRFSLRDGVIKLFSKITVVSFANNNAIGLGSV